MATQAFMGGQAGFDEGGSPIGQPLPKSISPSLVNPSVPGITPKLPTGAPPSALPTTDQLAKDPMALQQYGSLQPKDLPAIRGQELDIAARSAKTGSEAEIQAGSNLAKEEKSRSDLYKEIKDKEKVLVDQYKQDMQESSAFAPTKENAKDLLEMFSLMTIATFGSGGRGQYHGMRTLAALNGMMEGYNAGKKDRFEQEKQAFDKNLQAIKSHNDKIEKTYNQAMNLLSTDKEAGLQMIKQLSAEDNTGVIKKLADMHQYEKIGKAIETVRGSLQAVQDKIDKQNLEYGVLAKRFANEKELQGIKFENEKTVLEAKIQGEKDVAKIKNEMKNQSDDVAADLLSRGVRIADKKNRSVVEDTVAAKANLLELKNQLQSDPSLVGRQGQIRQFTDKYYQSFKNNVPFDDSNVPAEDQAALRFAKKYASMLTRYERALSGSGRTTVSFQQQYNALLNQNQFNAAGLSRLMDDMSKEVGSQAMTFSPKITNTMLDEMATEFIGRLNDEPAKDVTPSSPAVETGTDEKGSFHYEYNADRSKRRKVYG